MSEKAIVLIDLDVPFQESAERVLHVIRSFTTEAHAQSMSLVVWDLYQELWVPILGVLESCEMEIGGEGIELVRKAVTLVAWNQVADDFGFQVVVREG